MSDLDSTEGWKKNYEEWASFAKPMFKEGKAKEAFGKYPWFTTKGEPLTPLDRPASETRFGLLTTGGYSIEGEQEPMRGYPTFGDEVPQIREIPFDVDRSKLVINHPGYDHRFAKEDNNANLPFDRLTEMVADGALGSLAQDSLVLMGLQPNVEPLIRETIPAIIEKFRADDVRAVLLVPS